MRQQGLDQQKLDPQVQGHSAKPVRPLFVGIYAEEDCKGEVQFSHDWRLKKNGSIKGNGAIEVPYGTPRSPIHFRLHDDSGRQLKFFQDAKEAIWASVGQCPCAEGGGGQIEYPDSVAGGNSLKVDNCNSAECDLHYALRFKDKDNNVVVYDPVIRNKGGGP